MLQAKIKFRFKFFNLGCVWQINLFNKKGAKGEKSW